MLLPFRFSIELNICYVVFCIVISETMDSNEWKEFPLNDLIIQEIDPTAIAHIIIGYFRNNNVDINTNFGGYNCLHYAAATANKSLLQELEMYYREDIDYNATTTPGNETALHLVIQQNDPPTLRVLLRADIDPNIHRNVDGRTALHLAVLEEDKEILTYLLQNYSCIEIDAKDNDGATALHYAIQHDNWYRTKLLLDHHANQNIARKDGRTAMHIAAQNKSTAILRKLVYTCILNHLDVLDNEQMTPLYLSVIAENLRAVEILLKEGADPDWKPPNRESIIEFAVNHAHPRIFAALLKKSKKIDSEEISSTVFQAAVTNDDEDKVKILLDNGVNPNAIWKRNGDVNDFEKNSIRPLIDVVENNKPGMVKILLKYGAYVNTIDGLGVTPLHIACQHRQVDIVKMLLEAENVDVKVKDRSGITPLEIAISMNNDEVNDNIAIVHMLLKAGADTNIVDPKTGETLLHKAVQGGNLTLVKLLLDTTEINVDTLKKDGETALHIAAREGNKAITLALLEKGADPNIIANDYTALYLAVAESHIDIVKILLQYDYKEDKAIIIQQSGTSSSVLKCAVRNGSIEIVELILEANRQFPIRQQIRKKNFLRSCLRIAVDNGHLEIVEVLLMYGAKPDYRVKKGNNNPLYNNVEIMKLLIQHGCDVNARDDSNWALLHWAVSNRNIEVVTLLIAYGADPNIEFQRYKITPLHLTIGDYACYSIPRKTDSIEEEDKEILQLLLCGKGINVNVKDINSFTPFDLAVAKDRPDIVELLLQHKADPYLGSNKEGKGLIHFAIQHENLYILKELLEPDGNPEIDSPYGDFPPPLQFAIEKGNLEAIKLLLEYRADINKNYKSNTALGIAIQKQNEHILICLLKFPGLDVNEPCMGGLTPLHLTIKNRDKWLLTQLLERGADPYSTTPDGSTILHIAVKTNFLDLITILVKKHNIAVDVKNNEGLTALHLCCSKYDHTITQEPIITTLLDLGADLSARCNSGNSAIHYLAMSDSLDLIWPIKNLDAELLEAKNEAGDTPLHLACRELSHKAVQLLLEAGVSATVTNSAGETPIHCYISSFTVNSHVLNLTKTIVGCTTKEVVKKIMEKLVKKHNTTAVLNLMKFDKLEHWFSEDFLSSLMNFAIKKEYVEMVQEFLSSGADINFRREVFFNRNEHINLFLALHNPKILKILLADKNCEVNLPGKDSKTALHYAVERDYYNAVQMLLEKGANPDSEDEKGFIPYQYAMHVKMEELLLLYGSDPFYKRIKTGSVYSKNHKKYLISRAVMRTVILRDNTELERLHSYVESEFMKTCRDQIDKCSKTIDEYVAPPNKLDQKITYEDIVEQDYTKINEGNIKQITKIINSKVTERVIPNFFKYVRTQLNVMKHSFPIVKPIEGTSLTIKSFLEADQLKAVEYLENPRLRKFLKNTDLVAYTPRYSYEIRQAIERSNKILGFRNKVIEKLNRNTDSRLAQLPNEILEMILKKLDWNSLINLNKAMSS
ncbi:serine/threonine-protein phosphatase 6 regulatory ankyrin repeat subunit B-like [Harmonia axyridis]|uniref:serine/threonine-protein phosphatase 6 regulatory ankyrin repeat subunit B-like n=1 Tax=Harmonia axyridis TaxID=115357 RepID=UPI001E278F3F|nr:serine/threonine-protein phosphatase 6 regulatory ankyrin repeat subunit B-like [Harmonia axyridis]